MSNSRLLALIASQFETLAGAGTSANPSPAGYWKRIALAAEIIAGASSSANDFLTGWMKRAAVAIVRVTNFVGTGYNSDEQGYLQQIVDALKFSTSSSASGSLENQLTSLLPSFSTTPNNALTLGSSVLTLGASTLTLGA